MTDANHTIDETSATEVLAATRADLRDIMGSERPQDGGGRFPRSATMRALTGGGVMTALVVVGVTILATRPGAAGRLARALPAVDLLRQIGLGLR